LVHGDFRAGNAMVAATAPARIAAILDWEMATIGDPLADLGYLLALWTQAGDETSLFELCPVTRTEGFPDRRELVEMYASRSGRNVKDLRWYVTLALWKAAIFMEGNFARAASGADDDPFLAGFSEGPVEIARRAARFGPGGSDLELG
jgi:aminoglycoside phosphotransferase (APT) family kinase protein